MHSQDPELGTHAGTVFMLCLLYQVLLASRQAILLKRERTTPQNQKQPPNLSECCQPFNKCKTELQGQMGQRGCLSLFTTLHKTG